MRNVAILIFDEVEVLDFCGPFEVFSVTGRRNDTTPFNVYTVAESARPILARNNLSINPAHTFPDCPRPDILLVPGGYGTRKEMHNEVLTGWVKRSAESAELLLSVCTGALILAKAGLLEGLSATTHHGALGLLKESAPKTSVLDGERVVDNGKIILSAGISAGIDMSLHVVGKLLGEAQAEETAQYMEYEWTNRSVHLSAVQETAFKYQRTGKEHS
jgi:transcriptional regulator GlxA family with amidase domain